MAPRSRAHGFAFSWHSQLDLCVTAHVSAGERSHAITATLETRVQILFDPEQYERLEAEVRAERMSVGAFIRETVDARLDCTRSDARAAMQDLRECADRLLVLNFDHEVLELSVELIERTNVRGRDSVHAATALAYGIETVAVSDPVFDSILGLRRVDPLTV